MTLNLPVIRFVICTRNRPSLVKVLADDLCAVLATTYPAVVAHLHIVDDCTEAQSSEAMRDAFSASNYLNLDVEIIDRSVQDRFLSALQCKNHELCDFARVVCKILGQGEWDLAGTRNFAFLYLQSVSHDDDVIILLDDDMRFRDAEYAGSHFRIDGRHVLEQLVNKTRGGGVKAAGVGYWGRRDVSLVQHIDRVLDDVETLPTDSDAYSMRIRELASFPASAPVCVDYQTGPVAIIAPSGEGPGGISGAVLATTRASLASHHLISAYNEDWIWLLLLGPQNATPKRVTSGVLHAAPIQSPTSVGFLAYQCIGEAIYQLFSDLLKGRSDDQSILSSFDSRIDINTVGTYLQMQVVQIEECRRRSRSLENDAIAKGLDFSELFSILNSAASSLRGNISGDLIQKIRLYLVQIAYWQNLSLVARRIRL